MHLRSISAQQEKLLGRPIALAGASARGKQKPAPKPGWPPSEAAAAIRGWGSRLKSSPKPATVIQHRSLGKPGFLAQRQRKRSLFKTLLRVLQTNAPWFLVYLIGGLYIFGIFRIFKVARSSCSAC